MPRLAASVALAVPLLLTAARARADHRAFTHTFEYQTLPENETELGLYSDESKLSSVHTFGLALEVEHGITDHLDVALYQVFRETQGAAPDVPHFGFDSMQLQARYRFAERGDWPVDVELIGTGVKPFGPGRNVYDGSGKVVLERDLDKLTVAGNGFGNVEFGPDAKKTTVTVGWAGGLTYEVLSSIKVGGESWGQLDPQTSGTLTAYAGPAVAWTPSTNFWVALTPGFGLNTRSSKYDVQLAIGLHLD